MLKKNKIFLVSLLIGCLFLFAGCSKDRYAYLILPSGKEIKVKVAVSREEFSRGLSGIKKIDGDDGLFFIKEKPSQSIFWMAGMKFPLDIIYLDKDLVVVDIFLDKQPCIRESCELLYSKFSNVQYILEIPTGLANQYQLEFNKKIKITKNNL